jgi:uncharacterized protein (UPF0303 family)
MSREADLDTDEDLARIALQEERLRFLRFDAHVAWELGCALKEAAQMSGVATAIDISTHAQPLFFHAMAGTTPDIPEWVRRKRNTTLRFFRSSYAVGLELKRDGRTLESKYGLGADYAAHGGSFPIWIEGSTCIGAITVSGLPQREDHDLLTLTLGSFLGVDMSEIALR